MLSMKEAYEIVKDKGAGCDRLCVYENATHWIFTFARMSILCGREMPAPGGPKYSINKETGKVASFPIPPMSNLQILNEATEISQEMIKTELEVEGNGMM